MASLSRESSVEVINDQTDADSHARSLSSRRRRRSVRSTTRNFRRINLDDTTFYEEQLETEEGSSHVDEVDGGIVRRIESSGEEDSDGEIKKKRRRNEHEDKVDNNADMDDSDDKTCTICFEEFTNAGPHRLVCLKCGHVFGQSCIEKWIRSEKNAKCPQCKGRARISDIRRIFARTIKMVDTTELELLKESIKVYKAENENLKIEVAELKVKLQNAVKAATNAVESYEESSGLIRNNSLPLCLKMGPVLLISNDSGSRYIDASQSLFVVTCALQSGLFLPFGLKLVTKDSRIKISAPVHTKKPRCCVFSPFNNSLVLSTGEDKTLCVTNFGENSTTVIHRYELPANGWSCCWMSESEVAVGLINGRVLKFSMDSTGSLPDDLTDTGSRFPVIAVHWVDKASSLIVVSIRECCVYRQQIKTSIALGSIMSFCWNGFSDSFMLSFSPSGGRLFTEHALYKVTFSGNTMKAREVDRYRSRSNKQTRMINCSLWNVKDSLFSAIFDEAHSHLVVFNWDKERRVIEAFIDDNIIAIKELNCHDCTTFRLACLSETRLHIFELQCS